MATIPGISIDLETVQTNMVVLEVSKLGITAVQFSQQLKEHRVLCSTRSPYQVRMVANRDVSSVDLHTVIDTIKVVVSKLLP